jgi:hypothetical protein
VCGKVFVVRLFPLSLALSHRGRGDFKPPSLDGRGWGRVKSGGFQGGKEVSS